MLQQHLLILININLYYSIDIFTWKMYIFKTVGANVQTDHTYNTSQSFKTQVIQNFSSHNHCFKAHDYCNMIRTFGFITKYCFLWFTKPSYGSLHRRNVFLYCTNCMCYCPISTLHLGYLALTGDCAFLAYPPPPKKNNNICFIFKCFELWGHWKCPHKSSSPCNICHTHVIIQMCVLINHINMHTHTHALNIVVFTWEKLLKLLTRIHYIWLSVSETPNKFHNL